MRLPMDIWGLILPRISVWDLAALRRACKNTRNLPVSLAHRRALLPAMLHSAHICGRVVIGNCGIFYGEEFAGKPEDCGHRLIQVSTGDNQFSQMLKRILRAHTPAGAQPTAGTCGYYYRDYRVAHGHAGKLYIEQTYLWKDGVRVVYDVNQN